MPDADETLRTYDAAADAYRDSLRPSATMTAWSDRVAAAAGRGARVLELGSGPGHLADQLELRGLHVERTDGSAAFVAMMRGAGADARLLDIRTDAFGGPYDAVVANAVLLHLERAEFDRVLGAAHDAVRPGGLLAFTVKEGDGDEWHTRKLGLPRHFVYWRPAQLRERLARAGWAIEALDHVPGRGEDWVFALCRRPGR